MSYGVFLASEIFDNSTGRVVAEVRTYEPEKGSSFDRLQQFRVAKRARLDVTS